MMRYIDSSLRNASQSVASWLEQTLAKGVTSIRCQSGYFTLDGASLLLPAFRDCAATGAKVTLLLGSNGGSTLASHVSFVAGTLGIPKSNIDLGVVSFKNALFHPKVYHFEHEDGTQTAYVGSANMTAAGISGLNVEAGVILESDEGDDIATFDAIVANIDSWFQNKPESLSIIKGATDIEALIAAEIVSLKKERSLWPKEDEDLSGGEVSGAMGNLLPLVVLPKISPMAIPPASPAIIAEKTVLPTAQFLRATEASFHFPQGTHLGHILSILFHFSADRSSTPFDDDYIRLSGSLGQGRIAAYRRQIKYKILAAIELGLLTDIRLVPPNAPYVPELTKLGHSLWEQFAPHVDRATLEFTMDINGYYSSSMLLNAREYNTIIRNALLASSALSERYSATMLAMPAVQQLLWAFYRHYQTSSIEKQVLYADFFGLQAVVAFCDAVGVEPQTTESARHRVPFLINVLESLNIVSQSPQTVDVLRFAPTLNTYEAPGEAPTYPATLRKLVAKNWPHSTFEIPPADLSNLRGKFGAAFMTPNYFTENFLETGI